MFRMTLKESQLFVTILHDPQLLDMDAIEVCLVWYLYKNIYEGCLENILPYMPLIFIVRG